MNQLQKKRLTTTSIVLVIISAWIFIPKLIDFQPEQKPTNYTKIINSTWLDELELIKYRKDLQWEKQKILDSATYIDSINYYEKWELKDPEMQQEIIRIDKFITAFTEKIKQFEQPEYLNVKKLIEEPQQIEQPIEPIKAQPASFQ